MILAAKALLDEKPDPTDAEIIAHMDGNLCRCTGYLGNREGDSAGCSCEMRGGRSDRVAQGIPVVNHSVPRADGVAKVTGSAMYTSDMMLEHMAWAKVLRSPYAHARIVSIDTSAARRQPGVIDVLTGDDLDGLNPYYGHAVKDHPLLAIGKVRFVGEPVAAVIAEDELTAQEALEDIAVEYEELHPGAGRGCGARAGSVQRSTKRDYRAELFAASTISRGIEKCLPGRARRVGRRGQGVRFGRAHRGRRILFSDGVRVRHGALRGHRGIRFEGRLTVYSSAQHPFMVRHDLAEYSACRSTACA